MVVGRVVDVVVVVTGEVVRGEEERAHDGGSGGGEAPRIRVASVEEAEVGVVVVASARR